MVLGPKFFISDDSHIVANLLIAHKLLLQSPILLGIPASR